MGIGMGISAFVCVCIHMCISVCMHVWVGGCMRVCLWGRKRERERERERIRCGDPPPANHVAVVSTDCVSQRTDVTPF